MVDAVQGLQPIVIPSFEDLRSGINPNNDSIRKKEIKDNSKTADTSNVKTDIGQNKNVSEQNKVNNQTDFSKLSEKLKQIVNQDNLEMQFSLDKDTKQMILRVVNSLTNEVVQQFPPEVSLKIARMVTDSLSKSQVTNAKV